MSDTTQVATPIDFKAMMEAAAKKAVEATKTEAKLISFKSGVLSFNDQPAPGNKVSVIVLGFCHENQWFPNAYDPKKIVSADCWAVGYDEATIAPVPAKVTQLFHSDCVTCPNNEWESDPKGGKGKACKNTMRLGMVIMPNDPAELASADFLFARIPVTSGKNWNKYVQQIGNVVKRPPFGVITEMSTVPDKVSQFKVNFKFSGLLDDQYLEAVMPLVERMESELLFDNGVNTPEEEAPAKAPAKGKGKF